MAAKPKERHAAEAEIDSDRLLPGEDPSSEVLEDATHWRNVYQELMAFKERILDQTREAARSVEQDASQEIVDTDLQTLESEHRRFTHRLTFWSRRVGELEQQRKKPKQP
jgi:hypothetical protein